MSYTQFKLSSGEEIIAEVIDEPQEENEYNLVIRNAMSILRMEDTSGNRIFTFRPWMTYQLNKDFMQLLNFNHIIGEAKPDELLLEQYKKAFKQETKANIEDTSENLKDLQTLIRIVKLANGMDSDGNNVIKFPDKDKLH